MSAVSIEFVQFLRRPKPRVKQLKNVRAALMAKAADINNSINQAQREGQIPSNQIQLWMREVKELEDKSAATEEDFERSRCLGGWSWNCFSVNRRVDRRIDEIDGLMTRVNDNTKVAIEPPPPAVVQIPISNSTPAMEEYTTEILDHIAFTNAGVIGVYGMVGVGKTTLLKSINNHKDVAKFDVVIWAVASKECKMERIQMDIVKRLELSLKHGDSEEYRATKIFDFLKNKDCLLLLDDLWEPLDIAKLGMVHASSGQGEQQHRKVVVFTTRRKQVCGTMKASRTIEIKCLGPDQAWNLFKCYAGEDVIGSDARINRVARLIAEECAGLPLALVTVGIAMSSKKSWEVWNDALILIKQSQMPKVTGKKDEDPLFSAFKLSYDSLEDDNMRGCLLSCALWPEDHSIDKDELIQCWMGLGLIEAGAIHEVYNRGHSHIETLKSACLLEPGDDKEREVKMHDVTQLDFDVYSRLPDEAVTHDVIRGMALWLASDCGKKKFKWIVKAGVALNQALEEEGWQEAERASLMHNDIASLPKQLSTRSKLLVLMLQCNKQLKEIHGTLIQAMRSLTYLDLENTRIIEIPKEIGMLSHLRHLNLSGTLIRKLPAELGWLVKLKYLLLRDLFYLTAVAKGTISNLSSLRFLDLRGSKHVDCWDELDGLKGCRKSISIDIMATADLQRLCSLPHVSIWRLNVKIFCDSANLNQLLNDIIKSHNTRQSMEQLKIEYARMKEILINEGNEGNKEAGALECLKYLYLSYLHELKEITWKGVQPQIVFPNLRELTINNSKRLRNVNWALHLPSLSILHISDCDDMEELISDEGSSNSSSFGLKRMWLYGMPKLKRISPRPLNFPYLEQIEVLNCPLLKSSENRIPENRLNVTDCQQLWLDDYFMPEDTADSLCVIA